MKIQKVPFKTNLCLFSPPISLDLPNRKTIIQKKIIKTKNIIVLNT